MPLLGVAEPSTGVPVMVGVVVMVPVTVGVTAVPVPDGVVVTGLGTMLGIAVAVAVLCVGEEVKVGGGTVIVGSKVAVSTRLGNVSVTERVGVRGSSTMIGGSLGMPAGPDMALVRG